MRIWVQNLHYVHTAYDHSVVFKHFAARRAGERRAGRADAMMSNKAVEFVCLPWKRQECWQLKCGLLHAKPKFLTAEVLRRVGGLVFDNNGDRFANELATFAGLHPHSRQHYGILTDVIRPASRE